MNKKEKVFFRQFHLGSRRKDYCYGVYDSFNDIWFTTGMYGFGSIERKVRFPYSIDFLLDYFGDDIIKVPSFLYYDDEKLIGVSNGNKYIRIIPR